MSRVGRPVLISHAPIEKKDEEKLEKDLRELFEKFPASFLSIIQNDRSTLTISLKDLLATQEAELVRLLNQVLSRHVIIYKQGDGTCLIHESDQPESIATLARLIDNIRKSYHYDRKNESKTEGAVAGLLTKKLPGDLGRGIGLFLDKRAGAHAASTTKASAEEAHEETKLFESTAAISAAEIQSESEEKKRETDREHHEHDMRQREREELLRKAEEEMTATRKSTNEKKDAKNHSSELKLDDQKDIVAIKDHLRPIFRKFRKALSAADYNEDTLGIPFDDLDQPQREELKLLLTKNIAKPSSIGWGWDSYHFILFSPQNPDVIVTLYNLIQRMKQEPEEKTTKADVISLIEEPNHEATGIKEEKAVGTIHSKRR